MNLSTIIRENDEEQSLPPFHQRLAGFCLILAVDGRHKYQTLLNVAMLATVEHEERKPKQDRKMTMAEHIEYLNKLLLSPQPTIYQDALEIKEQTLFDSITFTLHGGFRQRKSQDKTEFERRTNLVVTFEKKIHGIGLIRRYQSLGLEGLRLINDRQYCGLMNSKRSLENQLSRFGNDSPEVSSIQIKLQEIELCRAAFSEWFLNSGYEIPVVEVKELEVKDLMKSESTNFEHSDEYRSIRFQGNGYVLTAQQAAVVKILHEHWQRGTSEVSHAYILENIDYGGKRLRDIFKKSELWGRLIVQVRKGVCRLNL